MDRRSYLASLGVLFGAGCSGGGSAESKRTEPAAQQTPVRQLGEAYVLPGNVRIRVHDAVVTDSLVHDDAFGDPTTLESGEEYDFLLVDVETTNIRSERQPLPTVIAYEVLDSDGKVVEQRHSEINDHDTQIYEPVSGSYHGYQWVETNVTARGWMRFSVAADRELRYLELDPGMQYGDLRIRWELGASLA